jgi:predicted lipoprotein
MLSVRTLAFGFALLAAPAAQAAPGMDTVNRAVDGFVRPAYAALAESTGALADTVGALCKAPSPQALEAARQGFAAAVDAWSEAEIIRFGPVTYQNRLERLLFWPDRKGIGLKQVQGALADHDPAAADPAGLAGKSVAMQGFGALEFVLFGTGAETLAGAAEPYRCAYGLAIARNIDGIARDVRTAWEDPQGFRATWEKPHTGNQVYRDETEAVTELMEVFINGLEMIRDVRLKGFLGETAEADKPRQAIYWRSGRTAQSMAHNLSAMRALFDASRLGEALPADQDWLAGSIRFEFANAARAAGGAAGPVAEALGDPARRQKLAYLLIVTTSLSELFGTRLADAFGLTAGFSSLDGD